MSDGQLVGVPKLALYVLLEFAALVATGLGVVTFIYAAYAYSRQYPPTEWVNSPGELISEMNLAPAFVFAGLPALGFVSVVAFAVLVGTSRARRRAWIVPVATVALTVCVVGLALLGLRKL